MFDVDGTLIGGESTVWRCFGEAFEAVAGFALTESRIAGIEEVTAREIVHQALADRPLDKRTVKECAIRDEFLRRLRKAHTDDSGAFPPTVGTLALLDEIRSRAIPVAIATGDWRETASFKLRAAGVPFETIPMATSSEHSGRADIISAAVAKAGGSPDDAIYVGDGLWDLRACRKLGIPFLGVGHGRKRLREAGAKYVLEDLTPEAFWNAMTEAMAGNR